MNKKKTVILFFVGICIVSGIVSLLLYKFSDEDSGSYAIQDNAALALVSASPAEKSGVSQDSTIILQWNHPVSAEAGNAAVIFPSVRGDWSSLGNSLIFTPQQFAAGTYYTVTIPAGTVMNDGGDRLKEDIFFSFETEDSAQRIPKRNSFSVDGRQFRFSEGDNVVIPVSCIGDDVTEVSAAVYRSPNASAYINAFTEFFAYPTWARQTIADYKVETGAFEKQSEANMAVVTKNGISRVDFGSLPTGLYLLRLTAADVSYDVAVNVGAVDASVVFDNGSLQLWSHRNGERFADAEVTVNGKNFTTDENGFLSVAFPYDRQAVSKDPSLLGIEIKDKEDEFVYFLSGEELGEKYRANLVLNATSLAAGDTLMASGYIDTEMGVPLQGEVRLELRSFVGTLAVAKVKTEDGCFSYTWDKEVYADGEYQVSLCYKGRELDAKTFAVSRQAPSVYILAKCDSSTVTSGEKVVYEVKAVDKNGQAVKDAMVTMNGTTGDFVNSDGIVKFATNYYLPANLSSLTRNAIFHLDSAYGTAEDVTVAVNVIAGEEKSEDATETKAAATLDTAETTETTETTAAGDILALSYGEDAFYAEADITGGASYYWRYIDGRYEKNDFALETALSVPSAITVAPGETIGADISTSGNLRRLTVVSLYKGLLPAAYRNRTFTEEAFDGSTLGQLEESRVFFAADAINAAFSSTDRNGDYFIRAAVASYNGSVVSCYIPVKVNGVTLLGDEERNYPAGYEVSLPFWADTEETMDYTLTLADSVFTGSAAGHFNVETDISAAGYYSGTLTLSAEGRVVATRPVAFSVYDNSTVFYNVKEGNRKNAAYVYEVEKDKAPQFSALLNIVTQPGDQLLQRMAKTLYNKALPTVADVIAGDSNENIVSYQNRDGGFSRYEGGESDLLLSVLVAEQKSFDYDKEALCGYLKYRLRTAGDTEVAALACWGLRCFSVNCADSMNELADTGDLTTRALLYLAEGYEAGQQSDMAAAVYRKLTKELTAEAEMLHMDEADDQYGIANTVLMLDLALKLQQDEAEGLMEFLLQQNIGIQTGRYLMAVAVLKSVDEKDIAVVQDATPNEGRVVLSLCPESDEDYPVLYSACYVDDNETEEAFIGDAVTMNVQWEKEDNCIYLVCVQGRNGVLIAESNGFYDKNGHYESVIFGNSATFTFTPRTEGENVAPAVYVLNLTTDEIVGKAVNGVWVVKK